MVPYSEEKRHASAGRCLCNLIICAAHLERQQDGDHEHAQTAPEGTPHHGLAAPGAVEREGWVERAEEEHHVYHAAWRGLVWFIDGV